MRKLVLVLSAIGAIGLALPLSSPADAAKVRSYARTHMDTYQGEGRSVFRHEPANIRAIHRRTFTHD
jgi:hypothetical protein